MGFRSALRNSVLGLLDQVPVIGSGLARTIEDHYPSPRERAQAARIAELEAEIGRLRGHTIFRTRVSSRGP